MQNFRKLVVWEKAHQLTLSIYHITAAFPKDELYGLTNQMRRSASSIPTNIADGCEREGEAELARFLSISAGSTSELEYQILLSRDLGYIDGATFQALEQNILEIRRMLAAFIHKLKHPTASSEN